MRKSSKRTLSLLLAVLMVTALFTVAPLSASAANVNQGTITLGETKTVTISNGGDIALWSFTPAQDVTIWFYSASDEDTYGYLYDAQMIELTNDDEGGNGNQFKITYSLTGGSTYYFGARFYSTDTTGDIRVTLTPQPLWEHDGARITTYNGNDAEVIIPDVLDGDAITTIGYGLFYDNSTVAKVTVPEGITEIESNAFCNCSSLTTVKLPNTLTEIGYSAFYGDDSLMTLEIPAGVTYISDYALSPANCRVMTFKTKAKSGTIWSNNGIITDGTTIYQCYEGSFVDTYLKSRVDSSRIKYIDDNATCTVSYDNYMASAKNITNMPVSGTANPDYTISPTIPTSDDLIFLGWDTSTNSNTVVYYPGETYTFTENITLYGVWACTLKFCANGELLYKKYVTDFSNISGSDIPVPAPVAAKFFDGYYYGDTKCFSYNQGFTYNNNLTSEDAVNGVIRLDAKWVEAAAVAGTTVSLDDVIRLNIYVDKKGSNDTLRFKINNKDHDYNLEGDDRMQGLSENDFTVTDEGDYLKVAVKVYAKEMADQFEIDCYNETKSQRAFEFITSAKNYLETLAANPVKYVPAGKADDLRNICYATLNYGAAAQKQFNHYGSFGYAEGVYNVPLANENVPASYRAVEVPANLAYDEGSQDDFSEFGLSYYASSLGLYDYTSYAVCFEVTGDSTPNVYDSNGEGLYPYEVGKAIYYKDESGYEEYTNNMIAYNIPDIPAKDILNDFTLKFELTVDGEIKTKEYTFSPKTYIAKVLNKTGVDPDYSYGTTHNYEQYNSKERQSENQLVDTVKAIYDYSTRAKSYFG